MRTSSVLERHRNFVRNDWQAAAIEWVDKHYAEESHVSIPERSRGCPQPPPLSVLPFLFGLAQNCTASVSDRRM